MQPGHMEILVVLVVAVLTLATGDTTSSTTSPETAQAIRDSLDFIRHEQQAQVADVYAQAHPKLVESNASKSDWELVPKTPPPTPPPSAPPTTSSGRSWTHRPPLPTPGIKGGWEYRRSRRQAPDGAGGVTPDRSEVVIGSNAIRVSKAPAAGSTRRQRPAT